MDLDKDFQLFFTHCWCYTRCPGPSLMQSVAWNKVGVAVDMLFCFGKLKSFCISGTCIREGASDDQSSEGLSPPTGLRCSDKLQRRDLV